MKIKYEKKGATIQYKELKPHIRKGIKEGGMYFLERIFGECYGHGYGCMGEDISFPLKKIKAFVELNDNGRRIRVSEYDELSNQKGEWVDQKTVNIRPQTLKHLRYRLCK